jgi:hypothetical protein
VNSVAKKNPRPSAAWDRARALGREARATTGSTHNPYRPGTQCAIEWRLGRFGVQTAQPSTRVERKSRYPLLVPDRSAF